MRTYAVNYRNALDRLRVRMNIILLSNGTIFANSDIYFSSITLCCLYTAVVEYVICDDVSSFVCS